MAIAICQGTVPFRRHVPLRRRVMEGMFVATSLALLWLIILTIDGRAAEQLMQALRANATTHGGVATQVSNTANHITRSAWELSFVYGPLMTFAAVALVLVAIMTRTSNR